MSPVHYFNSKTFWIKSFPFKFSFNYHMFRPTWPSSRVKIVLEAAVTLLSCLMSLFLTCGPIYAFMCSIGTGLCPCALSCCDRMRRKKTSWGMVLNKLSIRTNLPCSGSTEDSSYLIYFAAALFIQWHWNGMNCVGRYRVQSGGCWELGAEVKGG
jgi:hypothetical protein